MLDCVTHVTLRYVMDAVSCYVVNSATKYSLGVRHIYYEGVTSMSQRCYKNIAKVLQACQKGVTMYRGVKEVLQKCVAEVFSR
jgi:hypothetical protein